MAYTYILQLKNGHYYAGSCIDIKSRLNQHKCGSVKSTKYSLPMKPLYVREYETYSEARKNELQIKNWKSRSSIENLIKHDVLNIIKLAPSSSPV